jgi:hypothetical protein
VGNGTGLDVDSFLMDLDSVLELIYTVKANQARSQEILRPFSEAEIQTTFETACRLFAYATTKVRCFRVGKVFS